MLSSAERGKFSGVVCLKEPTDLPEGKRIRELLSSEKELSSRDWLELFLADREANVKKNIVPLKKSGNLILQDRYYYSTAAYQADSSGPEEILSVNRARGFPEPDILFYLDISPEAAFERIVKNRDKRECFETIHHLRKIYDNYQKILPSSAIILDASSSIEEILKQIISFIFSSSLSV